MKMDDQNTNRYQEIKLVNWYRSIDGHLIAAPKSFIDGYWLAQQPQTDIMQATFAIICHFFNLGSPGDEIGKAIPTHSL